MFHKTFDLKNECNMYILFLEIKKISAKIIYNIIHIFMYISINYLFTIPSFTSFLTSFPSSIHLFSLILIR